MSEVAPRVVRNAAALVIGGELLSGKIRDENAFALAGTLRALGIELSHIAIVPDDVDRITDELRRLRGTVDVVFTSGGVGPTHDDVTVEAVARALDVDVVEDPALLALLRGAYGEDLDESRRLMARVPRGSGLASNEGMRWPTVVAQDVWLLPGIPELFRMKLALVRDYLSGPLPFFSDFVLLVAEEVDIKPMLDVVVGHHPEVEIGSYPKWFDPLYKTRVTFDSRSAELTAAAAAELRQLLPGRVVTRDETG